MPEKGRQEKSTEVQVMPEETATGEIVTEEPTEPDKFSEWLQGQVDDGSEYRVDAHQKILDQILSAETPDEVLTPTEAYKARDMIGHKLLLHGFDMNESAFDVGTPFYASMRVTDTEDGQDKVVNGGHKKMIAQLIKLAEFGEWPYQVQVIEQGRSKKSGDTMLSLAKW